MERNIKAISDFVFISDKISKSDVLISPGTFRIDIIDKVLEIYNRGYAKYIITTGGVINDEGIAESEFQKQYLIDNGVPPKVILNEAKSTNTKENAIYAREKLDMSGIVCNTAILVSKTYHSRRILMTFLPSFSESEILVIPVVDDRNITVDNWYKDKKKTEKVLEEVEKIGKYFLKGDLSL